MRPKINKKKKNKLKLFLRKISSKILYGLPCSIKKYMRRKQGDEQKMA